MQQEYDDKVAGLAEVIDAAEPDVLALQEVGPSMRSLTSTLRAASTLTIVWSAGPMAVVSE